MGDDSDTDRLAGTIKEKEEVSENRRGRRRIRYGQCMERDTGRRESKRERRRKRSGEKKEKISIIQNMINRNFADKDIRAAVKCRQKTIDEVREKNVCKTAE